MMSRPPLFLRKVLLADALLSGATGLLLIFGSGLLKGLLGLPIELLQTAGLILIPFALLVGYLGTREAISGSAVLAVVIANAAWAAGSLLLLMVVAPTALGYAFVIAQAVVVAIFGELQFSALRKVTAGANWG